MEITQVGFSNPYMTRMSDMGRRPDPSRIFSELDQNGDGGLDQAEFQVIADKISAKTGQTVDVAQVFEEFDVDQDGVLSAEEATSAMEANRPSGPPVNGLASNDFVTKQYTESLISILLDSLTEESESSDLNIIDVSA